MSTSRTVVPSTTWRPSWLNVARSTSASTAPAIRSATSTENTWSPRTYRKLAPSKAACGHSPLSPSPSTRTSVSSRKSGSRQNWIPSRTTVASSLPFALKTASPLL